MNAFEIVTASQEVKDANAKSIIDVLSQYSNTDECFHSDCKVVEATPKPTPINTKGRQTKPR
jgi:hypothetical protein